MKKIVGTLLWTMVLAGLLSLSASTYAGPDKGIGGERADMKMHHLHIMMNHGITMVTEGSNLIMIAGMRMTRALDKQTLMHGQVMIAKGKEVVQRSLGGPEMMDMMKGENRKAPLMNYTHELGEAMLRVIDVLEKMDMEHMSSLDTMTLHHMHITLNHALQMASEGSNLIMLGQMGMAGEVDTFSLDHGKEMIKNARELFSETMEGKVMKDLHAAGITAKSSPMMKMTHEMADRVSKVIDLLSKMYPAEMK